MIKNEIGKKYKDNDVQICLYVDDFCSITLTY